MDNRIFISYKRVNIDIVEPIVRKIEQEIGSKCWIDLSGIEYGQQFDNIICKAIEEAEIVLFMMSKESLAPSSIEGKETWTQRELRHASAMGKRIVPISIDGSKMRDYGWFNWSYGTLNSVNYSNNNQRNKLYRDLRTWLGVQDLFQIKSEIDGLLKQWNNCNKNSVDLSKKKDVLLQRIVEKEKLIDNHAASTSIMSSDEGQGGKGALQIQIKCLNEILNGLRELSENIKTVPANEFSKPGSLYYRVCEIPEEASVYFRVQREGFTGNFEGSFKINYHVNNKIQQGVYYAAIQSYVGNTIDSIALGRTRALNLEDGKGHIAELATIPVDDNLIPSTLIFFIQKVKVLRCEKLNLKLETNNYGENITVYGLPKESFVDTLINFYLIPDIGIKSIKVYNAETESLLCIY